MRSLDATVKVDLSADNLFFEVRAPEIERHFRPDLANLRDSEIELVTVARAVVEGEYDLPAKVGCKILVDDYGQVAKYFHVRPIDPGRGRCQIVVYGMNYDWICCKIPAWRESVVRIGCDNRGYRILREALSHIHPIVDDPAEMFPREITALVNLSAKKVRDLRITIN